MHFAKIDLATSGFHRYVFRRFAHRDISALGYKLGTAANFFRSDVPATRVQIRVAGNVVSDDVPAGGECSDVAKNISINLNVAPFRDELCNRAPAEGMLQSVPPDALRGDISALRNKGNCAANVRCVDVADFRIDVEVVIGGNSEFEMNGELRAVWKLLRKRADNFNAVRSSFCRNGVPVDNLL